MWSLESPWKIVVSFVWTLIRFVMISGGSNDAPRGSARLPSMLCAFSSNLPLGRLGTRLNQQREVWRYATMVAKFLNLNNLSWQRQPCVLSNNCRKVSAAVLFLSVVIHRKIIHVTFFCIIFWHICWTTIIFSMSLEPSENLYDLYTLLLNHLYIVVSVKTNLKASVWWALWSIFSDRLGAETEHFKWGNKSIMYNKSSVSTRNSCNAVRKLIGKIHRKLILTKVLVYKRKPVHFPFLDKKENEVYVFNWP